MIDVRSLRRLGTSMRDGLRGLRQAPLVFLMSVSTMAAGLLMLSAYLLVVQNMRTVLETAGADLTLVAFLTPGEPDEAVVADLAARFGGIDSVDSVTFVSRERALSRLREDLGSEATILEDMRENPLPASFEIQLIPEARTPEGVRRVASRLAEADGVDDVRYGEAWVEGYARVLRALEWIGAGFGGCLMLVLAVIVAGTVRLAVYARSDEIQIQRLVGAGGLFVRLPFYLEGALQGATGAGTALLLLWLAFSSALPSAGEAVQLLLGRAAPSFFGVTEIIALILLGAGLGVGGSVLSLVYIEESP
ncbi:MAG: ABC transporter permease [Deltaproteobacteria bacterium]|nr:ABC transporter permease [Deltaproteobacteria bacterium]MBW2416341.1 ABC transporter permease [Deltaproteobacteria bacterium]